jgi:hypothetical protein
MATMMVPIAPVKLPVVPILLYKWMGILLAFVINPVPTPARTPPDTSRAIPQLRIFLNVATFTGNSPHEYSNEFVIGAGSSPFF